MALNFVGGVKNLTASVTSLKKELASVYDVLKKIKGLGPSAFGDINAVLNKGGQMGIGTSGPLFTTNAQLPTPKGNYGNTNSVPASKPSSAAQESAYLATGISSAKMGIGFGLAQTAAGVVAGAGSMLPNLGDLVQRGGTYYQSSAMFGGVNAMAFQRSATRAMSGGITAQGSDAAAANVLTMGYNFAPGSSSMLSTLGQVSGAAKALNMDNTAAAAAMGGMATGQMGAQLYQYGIRQLDNKGNQRPMDQIAKDLLSKYFYAGKDITKIKPEQLQKDLQYGGLQASLNDMNFTQDQQSLIKYSWGQQIKGKSGSLLDADTKNNPALAAYKINTSEANLANAVQGPMVDGFNKAASAVTALNKALEGTPKLILEMKGAMQGFKGSQVGSGITGMISSVFNGAMGIGSNLYLLKQLKKLKLGGAPAAATATSEAAATVAAEGAASAAATTAATSTAAEAMAATAATGSAATAGAVSLAGLPVAAMIYDQYKKKKAGEKYAAELQDLVNQQKNGWKDFKGPTGPTYMSEYHDNRSWWKKLLHIGGGTDSGFSADIGSASSLSMYSGSSSPMASSNPAASMAATSSTSSMVSQGFAAKDLNTWGGAKNQHTGEDTVMPVNTPVKARYAGKVVANNLNKDYGIAVEIDHGDGYSSIYAHLNQKSVRMGEMVKVGQIIGKSGQTGKANGPHLHFEIRHGNTPIDPKIYNPNDPNKELVSGTYKDKSKTKGKGVILGSGDKREWAKKLLQQLGDPITDQNIAALTTWQAWEGGHWKNSAHYNPLNTTLKEPGSSPMNDLGHGMGVQSYPNWGTGYKATVDTLNQNQRGYAAIRDALKKGSDTQAVIAAVNASDWGTHIRGGSSQGFSADVTTANGTPTSPTEIPLTSVGNSTNNVYVTLQIQQATEQEAIQFAKQVKGYLEKGNRINTIGSK